MRTDTPPVARHASLRVRALLTYTPLCICVYVCCVCPGDDLAAAKQALRNRYSDVLRIFDFYASLGAGDPFAMHIVPWGQLMMETGVAGMLVSVCVCV